MHLTLCGWQAWRLIRFSAVFLLPEKNVMADGFTKTPNWILDNMAEMKGCILPVVLYVTRQTVGYTNGDGNRKEWDRISISQFEAATSLSRQSIITAIDAAIKKGYIQRRERGQNFEYALVQNLDQSKDLTSPKIRLEVVQKLDQLPPEVVQNLDTQKKDIKEKKETTGGGVVGERKQNEKAPNRDPNFALVCKAYENNIGLLTENIGESIDGLLYEDNIPADWIVDAIRVACESEKRTLAYVKGILKRWKREGRSLQNFADSKKAAPAIATFKGSEK